MSSSLHQDSETIEDDIGKSGPSELDVSTHDLLSGGDIWPYAAANSSEILGAQVSGPDFAK